MTAAINNYQNLFKEMLNFDRKIDKNKMIYVLVDKFIRNAITLGARFLQINKT